MTSNIAHLSEVCNLLVTAQEAIMRLWLTIIAAAFIVLLDLIFGRHDEDELREVDRETQLQSGRIDDHEPTAGE